MGSRDKSQILKRLHTLQAIPEINGEVAIWPYIPVGMKRIGEVTSHYIGYTTKTHGQKCLTVLD